MKMLGLVAASAAALSVAAVAQPAAAPPSSSQASGAARGTRPHWQVDWSDHYCSLIRYSGGERSKAFAVRTSPGSNSLTLITFDPQRPRRSPRVGAPVSIRFLPSGTTVAGSVTRTAFTSDRRFVMEVDGFQSLLPLFETSSQIEVANEQTGQFTMRFPAAGEAIRTLRACEDDALARWGIDMAARAALRSPPILDTNRPVITNRDYPDAAIRARQMGRVLMRLDIGADGRVAACTILVGSGAAVLDGQSCRLFQERARFSPAIGADGSPTPADFVARVTWLLP